MKRIELLAPVGNMESLIAAVQCGADAVYLGGINFSARAYAGNFDDDKIEEAIDYCHLYGLKVYITMNTLIKENEMKEAFDYAKKLYSFGTDALIVQDAGLAHLLKNYLPDFELHASTQMTVHNVEGALFYKNLGFKRIVLARELSLKEVKNISNNYNIETEIFIHGALCICYSGQCLMSSIIGGRSGNRGRCAQPCRMKYTLINKFNNKKKSCYALSPKDICTIENINEIIETGTASLKIEGRMKRPEYVAGVVDIYRKAIDSYYNGTYFDINNSYNKLLKLFNREGFSKAYMFGNAGKDMMAFSLPKNTGVLLGKVSKKSVVKLYDGVKKGDGIRIGTGEEGFIVSSMSKNGKEVEYALKGEDVIIKPTPFAEGDILYKTSDISLLSELRKFYEKPFENKINIPLDVKFIPNSKLKLTAIFRNINFNVDGDIVEKPLNKPTSKEKLIENLSKSSETPIKFSPISIEYDEGFLPVSSINTSRREIADLIEKHLKIKREFLKLEINNGFSETKKLLPDVLVCVQNEIQLKAARELGFNSICMDIISNDIYYGVDYIKVPNIIKDEFETLCARIEKNLKSINGIVTSNAGIINRFKGKTKIIGDYKLNFFNSYSMGMYDKDLCGSCLSIELNKSEIAQVLEKNRNFFQVLLYGKPELMVSEYCLIGSVLGEKSKNKGCNKSCKNGSYVIKDRIGEEFSVISDNYCRTHIYNSLPINLISNVSELKKIGVNSFRLDFIDEGYEETINVLSSYKSGDGIVKNRNFTRGHFKRGVE